MRRRPAHGRLVRVDEQADADAALLQSATTVAAAAPRGVSAGQPAWLVISPGITGTSVHWCGPHLAHQREQIGPRIAFDVELDPAAQRREHARDRRARRTA